MKININAINTPKDIPTCMLVQDLHEATENDACIQQLNEYMIEDWPLNRN